MFGTKSKYTLSRKLSSIADNTQSTFIMWKKLPFDSEIVFISENISMFGIYANECRADYQVLNRIRLESDYKCLKRTVENCLSYQTDKKCEYNLEFPFSADAKKRIREKTFIFRESTGNVTGAITVLTLFKDESAYIIPFNENIENITSEIDRIGAVEAGIGNTSLDSLSNFEEIINLQKAYMAHRQALGRFYDADKNIISELTGDEEFEKYCSKKKGEYAVNKMVLEALNKTEERKAVAYSTDEEGDVRAMAIPLTYKESVYGYWAVIYNKRSLIEEDDFINETVSLSKTLSTYIRNGVESKVERGISSQLEKDLLKEINKNAVLADIIELLESDEGHGETIGLLLAKLENYLELKEAFIFEFQPFVGKYPQLVYSSHAGENNVFKKFYDYYSDKATEDGIDGERLDGNIIMVSDEDEGSRFTELAESCGSAALIILPIIIEEDKNAVPDYFLTLIGAPDRVNWSLEEIVFVSNIGKILKGVLYKQRANEILENSRRTLDEILNNMHSMVYVSDRSSKVILYCNKKAESSFPDITRGAKISLFEWYTIGKGNPYTIQMEDKTWYEVTKTELNWAGQLKSEMWVVSDVTRQKSFEEKVKRQANEDYLTGLSNRKFGEEKLQLTIDECLEEGKKAAMLFFDLDNFKEINDGMGHDIGDALLRLIAGRIMQISGVNKNCYRFGGDEFVAVIEPEDYDRMDEIVDEVARSFNNKWVLEDGTECYCTMSMGVVRIPENGTTIEELVKRGDIAMYEAKTMGKNRFVFFDEKKEVDVIKILDIEKAIRESVYEGCKEFEVHYQPVYDTVNDKFSGCEALVRWNSAKMGMVLPGSFVSFAEHMGTICQIGTHVMYKACEANRKWEKMGYSVSTHINLSNVQLMQEDILETIRDVIEATGVNPNNIVFEMTETIAMVGIERVVSILKPIRELGIGIALDDFGIEYSSLNYLKQLKPEIIKIDKYFVNDVLTDPYSSVFVRMIMEIASVIGSKVCVEGVETKQQFETIKEMGAHRIQGYYFARPASQEEFEEKYLPGFN